MAFPTVCILRIKFMPVFTVGLPSKMVSIFRPSIAGIITVRTKEQMVRITAFTIVALMADKEFSGIFAVPQYPSKAMGIH